ncbi:copper homeostasis protein CutC [Devosia sp. ZB163]|uniref:copper homeostasis protein CutC n=1 Tax=Devosia sp. ZB163 TaxID=3025938 RepID=UPI002360AA30|nr:copper homeostasis protein CutC [Devosia sp. ZB163]MDC9825114.1 copper homeostasis protein CutC [Devosia sp. ZB163]
MKLEVCVADPRSLIEAVAGGADRIELCSALELGGLTPLPGVMALAAASGVPAYAMIRPRSGDFVFDEADVDAMLRDIDAVRAAGLAGVVIGANRSSGELDVPLLEKLLAHSAGLGSTLHRAIDLVPDFAEATEAAVGLGVERILTSGGAHTALEGIDQIAVAHATARGRVVIMAGSGLRPDNVAQLLAAAPVDEVHSSCAASVGESASGAVRLGFAAKTRRATDRAVVGAFKAALAASGR